MDQIHSIVIRPVAVGFGSTSDDVASIQALIDQAHAGNIETNQADNAETALRSIQTTLAASGTPTTTNSNSSSMTSSAALLIGLGGGILLGSIAILALEQSPPRRIRQGAR